MPHPLRHEYDAYHDDERVHVRYPLRASRFANRAYHVFGHRRIELLLNCPKPSDDNRQGHQPRIDQYLTKAPKQFAKRFALGFSALGMIKQYRNDECDGANRRREKVHVMEPNFLANKRDKRLAQKCANIDGPIKERKPAGAVRCIRRLRHRPRNQWFDKRRAKHENA